MAKKKIVNQEDALKEIFNRIDASKMTATEYNKLMSYKRRHQKGTLKQTAIHNLLFVYGYTPVKMLYEFEEKSEDEASRKEGPRANKLRA